VGGLVAEVEGKQVGIGDLAGLRIETGGLEIQCAARKPGGLGHFINKDGFGLGGRLVFFGERAF